MSDVIPRIRRQSAVIAAGAGHRVSARCAPRFLSIASGRRPAPLRHAPTSSVHP